MIQIDYDKKSKEFLLSFRYNEKDLQVVRNLPTRTWDQKNKVWRVPEKVVLSLDGLLSQWTEIALERRKSLKSSLYTLVDAKFLEGTERTTSNNTVLRNYQSAGVGFLVNAKQAILADAMGLGKTIQSIQAIEDLDAKRVLILCPATLKWNWHQEFQKHFAINPVIISGNAQQRKEQWQNSSSKYIIANYDLLQRDWACIPKDWDAIVLDEAVFIKSHSAKRTKYAKKLRSPVRIALTGLPMELHLLEFHSIFDWAVPNLLPSLPRFKYRYCTFDVFGKLLGYKNIEELHLLTSPFLLRRTKKEVEKELPDKVYMDVPLEFSDEARKYYEFLVNQFFNAVENKELGQIFPILMKMRQFVEFPDIIGQNFSSVKLEWLEDIYAQTDKIVVFTPFLQSANRIIKYFKTPYSITGEVQQRDRLDMVNAFNAEKKGMIVCTDAGRFGINLTGADTIVQFGLHYNPAVLRQREDRLHRIGQTKTVTVFHPYIMHSIDEGIRKIFLARDANIVEFLDASNKMSIAKLSKKEFMKLVYGE